MVEYLAWCGGGRWEEYDEADPETFGEAAAQGAKELDELENMTPPKELKAFHSATIALVRGYYDLYRSQDANEPFDKELKYREFENTDEAKSLVGDLVAAWVDYVTAPDDETISQLVDAGLGDTDCTN